MKHKGSCLCGGYSGAQYEIHGALRDILSCHCSMCRKLHASAFRTRATIDAAAWKTTQGDKLIKFYESSPGEHKGFCSNCGSSLYTRFDSKPERYGFPLGKLDTDPGVRAERHVFVGSKAPWHDITDDLPQHLTFD